MLIHTANLYNKDRLEILFDPRNPYQFDDIHPEWITQFIKTINSPKVHEKLAYRLDKLNSDITIYYTKIKPNIEFYEKRANKTIYIISSVGEHSTTPWMIIHNIGHTIISNHPKMKLDVLKILDKSGKFSVMGSQHEIVDCASARHNRIPNINEVIYELFSSWVWHGETKTPNKKLAEYCNNAFRDVVEFYKGKSVHHKYRMPVEPHNSDLFGLLIPPREDSSAKELLASLYRQKEY